MIQRTLFNKLTLDRIDEVFAQYFPEALPGQIQQWREDLTQARNDGRQFYISVNDLYEMDGILLYDAMSSEGVLYACTPEAVQNLLERVLRTGQIRQVKGDCQAVEWAQRTNFLVK